MIQIFDDWSEAILWLEDQGMSSPWEYFKAEVLKTADGRWRIGIMTEPQLELDFYDGFVD